MCADRVCRQGCRCGDRRVGVVGRVWRGGRRRPSQQTDESAAQQSPRPAPPRASFSRSRSPVGTGCCRAVWHPPLPLQASRCILRRCQEYIHTLLLLYSQQRQRGAQAVQASQPGCWRLAAGCWLLAGREDLPARGCGGGGGVANVGTRQQPLHHVAWCVCICVRVRRVCVCACVRVHKCACMFAFVKTFTLLYFTTTD